MQQIENKLKTISPYLLKKWAEMVMGRNGMGRNGDGPKWSWAEMVMGRNDPEPYFHIKFKSSAATSVLLYFRQDFHTDVSIGIFIYFN